MKHFNFTKLLLSGILLLSLSACNKEPADIAKMPADYDLQSAINELPVQKETPQSEETEESISKDDTITPSELFACFGVNDKTMTDFRAGVFVPGSLPIAELYDSSLTSKVKFTKNGNYFDILFNYYKDENKLVAQYECPQAIKGNSFLDHVNEDEYKKKCVIEEKAGKYITSEKCKPRFYCQGPDVKLHIFENFFDENVSTNKVIKTFEIKNNNPCQNASKLAEAAAENNLEPVKDLLSTTDVNIATSVIFKAADPSTMWEIAVFSLNRPLLNAVSHKKNEIAKLLLENGADPNLSNLEDSHGYFIEDNEFDALGWALTSKNEEIIDLVLPKIKSKNDSLVAAACYGQNKVVKAILEEDTSAINKSKLIDETNHTPLSCALSNYPEKYTPQRKEVVKTLVAYGADVNKPDPSGQDPLYFTPLRLAVFTNDLETVKLLIDNGADVNAKDNEGNTALKLAQQAGNTKIVELLKAAGAKE